MQLFCNFSFVLFFQKGRALARISLFERSERDLLYFTFLCVLKCRFWGSFFRQNPSFGEILLFDLLLFLMVEKALVFVCIDI